MPSRPTSTPCRPAGPSWTPGSSGPSSWRPPNPSRLIVLGGGAAFGLANEAVLKATETSQVPASAFHPLEFRHGPMSVCEPGMIVVGILGGAGRGGRASRGRGIGRAGRDARWCWARTAPPRDLDEIARLPLVLHVLQALALGIAVRRGLDPGGTATPRAGRRHRPTSRAAGDASLRPVDEPAHRRPSTSPTCSRRASGPTACCWRRWSTPPRPSSWASRARRCSPTTSGSRPTSSRSTGPGSTRSGTPAMPSRTCSAASSAGSCCCPSADGRLDVGTWQRVIFLELDGPRRRSVAVASLATQPLG